MYLGIIMGVGGESSEISKKILKNSEKFQVSVWSSDKL